MDTRACRPMLKLSLFFLMGPPLRLLVALSAAYFFFLLACLLSLIRRVTWHQAWPPWQLCLKKKRVSSDTSATANVWAQNL